MGNIQKSIKNLGVSVNGVEPTGETTTEILKSFGAEFTGKEIAGETISEVIYNIAENYAPAVELKVEAYKGNADLFGKFASDLQENIVVASSGITGTLKYVEDYSSAFSGEEASGNYLVLRAKSIDGAVITGEVVGGTHGPVTLDEDGILICRIASNEQSVKFVATTSNGSATVTYTLTNLVLEEAPAEEEAEQ